MVLSDAAISVHTLGEHVISQTSSKRSCLFVNLCELFIYLIQITNKSKIKTGM